MLSYNILLLLVSRSSADSETNLTIMQPIDIDSELELRSPAWLQLLFSTTRCILGFQPSYRSYSKIAELVRLQLDIGC